jgi:retron-type reverse transcriptase
MSKEERGRNSSLSEKPVRSRLRRLVDWINLTGAKKVHSLIDKVYKRKNLEMAWEKVKENRGSGGVDGQSLAAFESQLGLQLARLEKELKENTYRPQPVLQHPSRRGTNLVSIAFLACQRSMIACASKRCSIG